MRDLVERYPQLASCTDEIKEAFCILKDTYNNNGKLLVAGNGGSAADAEHIAGELMKRFRISRPISEELSNSLKTIDAHIGEYLADNLEQSLCAIPLVAHEALTTAFMNDVDAYGVFSQQLLGYGKKGDCFLAISTSGNSKNIIYAAVLAKAMGIKVVGLTGNNGGELANISDLAIKVPEHETYKIQELHLPVYHTLCMMLEEYYFG